MSTTVDNRVVEMRFDNRQFENGIQTSMSSINKLNQTLNLTGTASKGLESLQSVANRFSLSGLGGAADAVAVKFSHMQMSVQHQLDRIVTGAVNAGNRIVKALTVDPIKTGFQEYETQINAVQTILANTESKGTTLDDVNSALDELNTYADKTIYNFTQMTRNIGTFTAAGVDLDKSVTSIKGIANLAAVSGSTSQQASTAMYQLSQALAAGRVSLMDWNSVVNAGMGGQVFQDALKRTAENMGYNVDALIKKYGSFRESLTKGEWLTAEVLTETLTQLSGAYTKADLINQGYTEAQAEEILKLAKTAEDAATKVKTFSQLWETLKESAQSGWTQTWELIVGDFEEAKELLTEISDTIGGMIGKSAEARNELLKGWKDHHGRDHLIESLRNSFEGVMNIITPIKEAFREIFPPITVKQLVAFTEGIKNLTEKFKMVTEDSDTLKRTFKGVFAFLDIGVQIIKSLWVVIKPIIGFIAKLIGILLEGTAYLGDWIVKIDEVAKKTDFFNFVIQGVIDFVKLAVKNIRDFIGKIGQKFGFSGFESLHAFIGKVQERMSQFGEIAGGLGSIIWATFKEMKAAIDGSAIGKALTAVWNGIKNVASGIGKIFDSLFTTLGNADFSGFFDIINAASLSAVVAYIIKFVHMASDAIDVFEGFGENALGILESVRGCFETYQNTLRAGTLLTIASAIAILTASIFVISLIDSKKLYEAVMAITSLMFGLMISFRMIDGIDVQNMAEIGKICIALIGISVSVFVLALALKQIGELNFAQMLTGLIGVLGLAGIIVATAKILGSSNKTIIKGAAQMVIFAFAIKVLASAVKDLGGLSWEKLAKGLLGVGALVASIIVFLEFANLDNNSIQGAAGVVLIAAAIKILASAVEDFGYLDWEQIAKGLVSIGALLLEVALFAKLTSRSTDVISTAAALVIIGGAMKVFAWAMEDFGDMSWEKIGRGLTAMAGALLAVGLATKMMPKDMPYIGVGLVLVSGALLVITKALEEMSGMSWGEIGKGLATLGGSIAILAAGLRAMTGTTSGSLALLTASGALLVLIPVFSVLGAMSWESIAKGLVAVAGALTIIGVAGLVLGSAVPAIIGVASAVALVGAGILATGQGLVLFGAGLAAVAGGFMALSLSATTIVATIDTIVMGILGMLPKFIDKMKDIIVAWCKVITDSAPAIGEAFKAVLLTIIDVISTCVPALAEGVYALIVGMIKVLAEYTPQMVEALADWLVEIFDSLAEKVPDITDSIVNLVETIFNSIADAMRDVDKQNITEGTEAIKLLYKMFAHLSAIGMLAPTAVAGAFAIVGVLTVLKNILDRVDAVKSGDTLSWLAGDGAELLKNVGNAIGSFVGGIASGYASALAGSLPQIGEDLSAFMTNVQGYIEGAKNIKMETVTGIGYLSASIAALSAAEMMSGIASFISNGSTFAQLGSDLAAFMTNVQPFINSAALIKPEALNGVGVLSGIIAILASAGYMEGLTSLFNGGSSIDKFADELPDLGKSVAEFAGELDGFDESDLKSVECAAKAIAAISGASSGINGQTEFGKWLLGDNSVLTFSKQLPELGENIKKFADNLGEFDDTKTDAITCAVNAIKNMSEVAKDIPNEGGWLAAIVGDNSIATFGGYLPELGTNLKDFAKNLGEFDDTKTDAITCAVNAIKVMSDVAQTLPNEGGWLAAIVGDNSIATFGGYLPELGDNIKKFADNLGTFEPNSVEAIKCATDAIKSLAECSNMINGQPEWAKTLLGDNSIATFSGELPKVGENLASFADKLGEFSSEQVASISCASEAIKTMATAASVINGQPEWAKTLLGDNSIATFSGELPKVGENLASFADKLGEFSSEQVTTVSCASQAIAAMAEASAGIDGQSEWGKKLFGDNGLGAFSEELPTLGENLASFVEKLGTFASDQVITVNSAVTAIKAFAELADSDLKGANKYLGDFGENIVQIATDITDFCTNMPDAETTSAAIENLKSVISTFQSITATDSEIILNFSDALEEVSKNGVTSFAEGFTSESAKEDIESAVEKLMDEAVDGIESKISDIEDAAEEAATEGAAAIEDEYDSFYDAGSYLVDGFAAGISENDYKASAKAAAMANAARKAAEAALDINSPSKVFYGIGDYAGQGFVNALIDSTKSAYNAGGRVAENAKNGLSNAISKISAIIESDMDTQPTIRPVLDLSDVEAGAGTISGLFSGRTSVGVLANVGNISSMMNNRQNGSNSEVVSAIDKLRKDLGNTGNTVYNVNGITYDDGSNVSNAIQELVRAAKIERRV